MTTAFSGIWVTGIWPIDLNVFKEHNCIVGGVTDIESIVKTCPLNQHNIPDMIIIKLAPVQQIKFQQSFIQQNFSGCSHWQTSVEKQL